MSGISLTDWVGYLAMILVISSFVFKDIIKLRIVNLVGAIVFITYGFMLNAWPIIATNLIIIIIQIYHLFKPKLTTNEPTTDQKH